jgi:uncharacterized protein YggE
MMRYLASTLAVMMIAAPSALSVEPSILPPSITVSGLGRTTTRPDMAEISIGVASQAPTAAAALTANNAAMANLMATLKTQGVEERDILTSNFSVNPEYRSDEGVPNRAPKIVSYRVDNSVQVKVRKVDSLGPLLDAVVRSGANNINGISFTVAQPDPILDRARANAITDAKRKAELYANAAAVKLGRVLYISETGGVVPPVPKMYAMEAMRAQDSSVPVAAGEQTMESSVTVIYAIDAP